VPVFSNSLRARYTQAVSMLSAPVREGLDNPGKDLESELQLWIRHFGEHCVDERTGEVRARYSERDSLYLTELWLRYVQLRILRAIHMVHPERVPTQTAIRERCTIAGRFELGSWYERDERFCAQPVTSALPKDLRELLGIGSLSITVWDLTTARRWFRSNRPNPGETSWEPRAVTKRNVRNEMTDISAGDARPPVRQRRGQTTS
jgi:hypothetical protein